MMNGINEASDEDLIILNDNDEIPNLESKQFKSSTKKLLFLNNFFVIINLIYCMIYSMVWLKSL